MNILELLKKLFNREKNIQKLESGREEIKEEKTIENNKNIMELLKNEVEDNKVEENNQLFIMFRNGTIKEKDLTSDQRDILHMMYNEEIEQVQNSIEKMTSN